MGRLLDWTIGGLIWLGLVLAVVFVAFAQPPFEEGDIDREDALIEGHRDVGGTGPHHKGWGG